MKTFSKISLIGAASVIALTACTQEDPGFEEGKRRAIEAQAAALTDKGDVMLRGGTVDAGRDFLGRNLNGTSNSYTPDHGEPFPDNFERPDALQIVTPEPVGVQEVELLLQELTNMNVVMRTRMQSGEEDDATLPINKQIRINHEGPLSELVRTVASRFDLSWSFDGETITFDRMATVTYDVPLPSASGSISTQLGGVNVGGNSMSTSRSVDVDPWAELTAAIESVLEDPATVTVSRNSGQVTIFAPASAQREAARIVETFDELYSKRIGLEIATFYVDTEQTAEMSTDLGLSIQSGELSAQLGQGIASAMQGGIGVISGDDVTASFNLRKIAGSDQLADYQMSNTVAQNGVVAPVVLTNTRRYVSEITNGTEDTGPTVETDNINSGISIYALPRLMRNGKIHLSVWVTQAELNNLDTFDTGTGMVQLPDSDQRAVEYTLTMTPGETLVMGGYEQDRAASNRDGGLGGLSALGIRDNRDGETTRTRMVLMVRPTLLGN